MEEFKINYALKPADGKYNPAKWNAQDANEVVAKHNAFIDAMQAALLQKDEVIEELKNRLTKGEEQIERGLVNAGFVAP
ncbi:hypothetical protein [Mucilaginibacter sp. CSA2-8R]|uniref:hypothetical protein n=1 Tax=Mucilaginibacter sp. CSA2-8R TaxID=3141542 RepID=UPI00315D85AA